MHSYDAHTATQPHAYSHNESSKVDERNFTPLSTFYFASYVQAHVTAVFAEMNTIPNVASLQGPNYDSAIRSNVRFSTSEAVQRDECSLWETSPFPNAFLRLQLENTVLSLLLFQRQNGRGKKNRQPLFLRKQRLIPRKIIIMIIIMRGKGFNITDSVARRRGTGDLHRCLVHQGNFINRRAYHYTLTFSPLMNLLI